ncbi:hypothetical protein SDC9_159723 [bioreactor metagenome]|uniref:Uncharacterized protein n=1 Tax=bioreactor metagenome TaxID=1076179 RepID=A0A645FDC3_9ZZZZ
MVVSPVTWLVLTLKVRELSAVIGIEASEMALTAKLRESLGDEIMAEPSVTLAV